MRARSKTYVMSALLALAGCSSADEKLCRAMMTEELLNPETAKFSGFSALSAEVISNSQLLTGAKKFADPLVGGSGARYYKAKLQAQGQLGNIITEEKFCVISADESKCACI